MQMLRQKDRQANCATARLELRRRVRVDDLALTGVVTGLTGYRNRAGHPIDVNLRIVEDADRGAGVD